MAATFGVTPLIVKRRMYFPEFLEHRRTVEKALTAVIQVTTTRSKQFAKYSNQAKKIGVTGPLRMISCCALSAPRAPHSTRGSLRHAQGHGWRSGLLLSRTLRNRALNSTGLRMMRVLSSG